jgi:hypothetical protein
MNIIILEVNPISVPLIPTIYNTNMAAVGEYERGGIITSLNPKP